MKTDQERDEDLAAEIMQIVDEAPSFVVAHSSILRLIQTIRAEEGERIISKLKEDGEEVMTGHLWYIYQSDFDALTKDTNNTN